MVNPTIIEIAKRLDPNGNVASLAMLLSQSNEILTDMMMVEGNLPTGHRVTIQTGLPQVYYRAINQGIPNSKQVTTQVDEGMAIAESRSEVDIDALALNGNTAAYRRSEALGFIEAMNQKIASGLFYGNPANDPKEFLGLMQRYSDVNAGNGQNIIKAGGSGALAQTSIYLVYWGPKLCYGIYPKGSKAGLLQEDLGRQTSFDTGVSGNRLEVMAERFQWKLGLCVHDWRSVVRICNLETSAFTGLNAGTGSGLDPDGVEGIIDLMARALARVPASVSSMGRPAFYMNSSTFSVLMRSGLKKSQSAVDVQSGLDQFGRPSQFTTFLGVPIRRSDAILNTEAVVP